MPTDQEYVDKYKKDMNISSIDDWNVYMAFSFFRIAAIAQGVYKRSLAGNHLVHQIKFGWAVSLSFGGDSGNHIMILDYIPEVLAI